MNERDTSSFLLYRARDSVEGALLKAMLEENGIEAWISGGQAAIVIARWVIAGRGARSGSVETG